MNFATVLVLGLVLLGVCLALRRIHRGGVSSCCGCSKGCAGCPSAGGCRMARTQKQ